MGPTVKLGLAKAGITSNLHTAVRYGPFSIGSIGLFHPILIQGAGRIDFLVKN